MEKERIKLFPDELPSGKRFKVKKVRSGGRTRGLVALFSFVMIFALGFATSEGIRNGSITLPDFFNVRHTASSPASAEKEPPQPDTPPSDSGGEDAPQVNAETLYDFDYSLIKAGEVAVIPLDLSLSEYGDTYIYNDTDFLPELDELLSSDAGLPAFSESKDPLVLIIHTHTSEAYSEEGRIAYGEDEEYARSDDDVENVVAVGEVMARILNENGIITLHSKKHHDAESYRDSYARSAQTVEYYLKKYPSIKYVFDIHRDSIIRSSGEIVRPVTVAEGKAVAQIMCVVGTDQLYGDYAWERNLALALKIRSLLNEKYGNMARGTCLRPSSYNQELSPVSLLFEIGAGGNSISEAKESARILALELVDLIKGE